MKKHKECIVKKKRAFYWNFYRKCERLVFESNAVANEAVKHKSLLFLAKSCLIFLLLNVPSNINFLSMKISSLQEKYNSSVSEVCTYVAYSEWSSSVSRNFFSLPSYCIRILQFTSLFTPFSTYWLASSSGLSTSQCSSTTARCHGT